MNKTQLLGEDQQEALNVIPSHAINRQSEEPLTQAKLQSRRWEGKLRKTAADAKPSLTEQQGKEAND